jgi:outer membrane protein OmpA-like peptidoglycan-associated protein
VLAEIADVMKRQPDWKLRVEGHTDNVVDDNATSIFPSAAPLR